MLKKYGVLIRRTVVGHFENVDWSFNDLGLGAGFEVTSCEK
jgi:hypothetical protein